MLSNNDLVAASPSLQTALDKTIRKPHKLTH